MSHLLSPTENFKLKNSSSTHVPFLQHKRALPVATPKMPAIAKPHRAEARPPGSLAPGPSCGESELGQLAPSRSPTHHALHQPCQVLWLTCNVVCAFSKLSLTDLRSLSGWDTPGGRRRHALLAAVPYLRSPQWHLSRGSSLHCWRASGQRRSLIL